MADKLNEVWGELKEGWGSPRLATKAHYFLEGDPLSICKKWIHTGSRENSNHDSRDNCAECKRRRGKACIKGEKDAG